MSIERHMRSKINIRTSPGKITINTPNIPVYTNQSRTDNYIILQSEKHGELTKFK
jgi:hypothetical protein